MFTGATCPATEVPIAVAVAIDLESDSVYDTIAQHEIVNACAKG